MTRRKLPGLTDTSTNAANDAFQNVADEMNVALAGFVSDRMIQLLKNGELPADSSGAGPTVIAIIAAMLNCAGRLCASFEPHINGDVLASIVKDQFNEGRMDQKSKPKGTGLQ